MFSTNYEAIYMDNDAERLNELNRKRVQRYRQRQREQKNITSETVMDAETLPEAALHPDIPILPDGVMEMLQRETDWMVKCGYEPPKSPNVQARFQAMIKSRKV